MTRTWKWFVVLAMLLGVAGCTGDEPAATPAEEDDLVPASGGKEDTGYLSSLATELQGEFVGELRLDLSAMSESERTAYVSDLQSNTWTLRSLVDSQLNYAKNQLNAEKLHLNLGSAEVWADAVALEGTTLRVTYRTPSETIVSFEELEAAGIQDPQSLTERVFNARVPFDPRDVFAKAGETCATGFDAGSLADYNYFYYWDPGKAGCTIGIADATYTIKSLLPASATYPEYDRLRADGKVTVSVFFGAAGHEETVNPYDEGMRNWRNFTKMLRDRGFKKGANLTPGVRYSRRRANLDEIVDVVSPEDLHALNEDTDGVFTRALQEHEVMIYDGHSFYGSLGVLEDRANYPEDTYQIIFMNSCWSYEYYTRQVFAAKATPEDPEGWLGADVVNNTEAAWFLNMADETRILLTNLFAGAETGGKDGNRYYTWANINADMNDLAIQRWQSYGLKSHEIYGVSGVRTNRWDPEHPLPPPTPVTWNRQELALSSDHPYADDANLRFPIEGPAEATKIRLVFTKVSTEQNYDYVEVYASGSGQRVARYTGEMGAVTTTEIPGNRAEIRLTSDGSVTGHGFDLVAVEWR